MIVCMILLLILIIAMMVEYYQGIKSYEERIEIRDLIIKDLRERLEKYDKGRNEEDTGDNAS